MSAPVKYTLYWAVRVFARLAWYRNRADRAAGFDRVLPDVHLKSTARAVLGNAMTSRSDLAIAGSAQGIGITRSWHKSSTE